jgi:hypothetical protein
MCALKEAWWRAFHIYNQRARHSDPLYGRIVG